MLVSTIRIKASAAVKEVILRIFTPISFSPNAASPSSIKYRPCRSGRVDTMGVFDGGNAKSLHAIMTAIYVPKITIAGGSKGGGTEKSLKSDAVIFEYVAV
jgi:hypothetical protein